VDYVRLFFTYLIELGKKLEKAEIEKLINLPYCSSKTEFEDFYQKLLNLDLTKETKDYYAAKYQEKEKWCMAFKKTLPCLKINTTSRIEGLNGIIKKNISVSNGLLELFYRLIEVSDNANNAVYSDCGIIHSQLLSNLESNLVLMYLKAVISPYAYSQTALNLSKAFNYEVKLYAGKFKVKGPEEPEVLISKSNSLCCECKYFCTMGLLCCHLLAIGIKYKEISLKDSIRDRWKIPNNSDNQNDKELIEFIKVFLSNQSKGLKFYF